MLPGMISKTDGGLETVSDPPNSGCLVALCFARRKDNELKGVAYYIYALKWIYMYNNIHDIKNTKFGFG